MSTSPASQVPFTKMQSLGNDFVLIEEKNLNSPLTPERIRWIADRRQGIGCDQLILLKESPAADADVSFYNADGSITETCGNGTRCVAHYLGKETGFIQTPSFLSSFQHNGTNITISLQPPIFLPTPHQGHLINLGNPHVVIFTKTPDELEYLDLEEIASALQSPESTNVELAAVISPTTVRVKTWERGVGLTPACGSGACAVGILSLKLGFVKKLPVVIEMEGGLLEVEWTEGIPPLLTGPAHYCFKGIIDFP